ncbi:MAG: helix-turn-helix domain-containing protein [Candidatus Ornithospirochaeta sp.]
MTLGERIRGERKKRGLSQEELADILNVSRQAITKWETDRGIPDIANLIRISEEFEISLDELIKGDNSIKRKIIYDSTMKKWHILVVVYLLAIVAYIVYFALFNRIFMVGFLVATLFMLGFELRIIIKGKRYQKNRYAIPDNA